MYQEIHKLLKSNNLKISQGYLRSKLETHPYYPTLLSVKDTLEDLNVNVDIFQTELKYFSEITIPFLAHQKGRFSEKLIFNPANVEAKTARDDSEDFQYSGIVITASANEGSGKIEENKAALNRDRFLMFLRGGFLTLLLVFLQIYLSSSHFNILQLSFLLLGISGIILSYFIEEKELGIANKVSEKICRLTNKNGCDSVLYSKGAKIFKWLSWGDVGLTFFVTMVIYWIISAISTEIPKSPLYYVSIAALLFPIYSLYYQLQVVKQFCTLCLGVLGAIVVGGAISIYEISSNFNTALSPANFYYCLLYLLLAVTVLFTWLLAKDILIRINQSLKYQTLYKRLKRNPSIFLSVLESQPTSYDGFISDGDILKFGNDSAYFKLLVACSPFCNPCALAHELTHKLFNKYPDHVQVGIRFVLTEKNLVENDEKLRVVEHILKYAKEKPGGVQEILHYWFANPSFAGLMERFPVTHTTSVENITSEFVQWNSRLSIRGTPTFWINGKELPFVFNWTDLFQLLPIIIDDKIEASK